MDEKQKRYTVENSSGTFRKDLNHAGEALRLLCALANADGSAHLIDRLPAGYVRGFVLRANT